MSYTKTNWVTGDVVTGTKLNKIEQGIYDIDNSALKYTEAQTLTDAQKAQARTNIGAINKTVNDLVNYYLKTETYNKTETYSKTEIQSLLNNIKQFTYEVAATLPTASASTMNKIYLVPSPHSETQNVKDEYITIQSGTSYTWEQIGSTSVDLSGYYTKTQMDAALGNKADIVSAKSNAYENIKQISDYLFEVQYTHENIDYSLGNTYFAPASGCSGVVKNGRVLRHLDWYYNDGAEFVIRTASSPEQGLKASVGICSGITGLTKSVVESGAYNEKFKIAPLIMTDGINEDGVYIQSNVVPKAGITYNLNPDADEDCCITMVLRYILDHCSNLTEAKDVFENVHIYGTNAIDYGYHFLIAKGSEWCVIELTATGYVVVDSDDMPHGIMTNFRTSGLTFDDNDLLEWGSVEDYGIGVERYQIAEKAFTSDNLSLEDLREELMYSNAYTNTNNLWYTEFAGYENPTSPGTYLKVEDAKTDPGAFISIFSEESEKNLDKTRSDGKGIWHTTHSAIYDVANKSFNVVIQERLGTEYDFYLDEGSHIDSKISEINTTLATKADVLTTYTKTQVDTALSGKQSTDNRVTSISSSSTDTQYPSAKCVYDTIQGLPSGLSNEAKNLIITILKAGAYISDQHAAITALETELDISPITVSQNGSSLTVTGIDNFTSISKLGVALVIV